MSENPHSHNDEVQDSSASAPVHSIEYSHDEQTDATVPLTPEYAAELREPNVPADADAAEVTVPWGTHPSTDTAERKGGEEPGNESAELDATRPMPPLLDEPQSGERGELEPTRVLPADTSLEDVEAEATRVLPADGTQPPTDATRPLPPHGHPDSTVNGELEGPAVTGDQNQAPTRYQAPVRLTTPPPLPQLPAPIPPHQAPPPQQPYVQHPGPPQYIPMVPVIPVVPVMPVAQYPAALPNVSPQALARGQRGLRNTLCVRLLVLAVIALIETSIIAQYTREMAMAFGVLAVLYAVVQVWPLIRPPRNNSDASVYIAWGVFSMISFVGVGLLLAPITLMLLVLDWRGISLGMDPMLILCVLAVLWLLEVILLSVTLYRFGSLRMMLTQQAPLMDYLNTHGR